METTSVVFVFINSYMWFVKFSLKRVIIFPFQLCSFFFLVLVFQKPSFDAMQFLCDCVSFSIIPRKYKRKEKKSSLLFKKEKRQKRLIQESTFIYLFVCFIQNKYQSMIFMNENLVKLKITFKWFLIWTSFLFKSFDFSFLFLLLATASYLYLFVCMWYCI